MTEQPGVSVDLEVYDGITRWEILAVVVDEVAPAIGNITPAAGTPIRPETRIAFDVTDVVSLTHVAVVVAQGRLRESAYDGTAFAPGYAASTIAAIANGYHFVVARSGGWIAPPTFSVVAVDGGGNKL